ncbi:XAF1 factor, partial [Nothoprocta ornata]|nr:XAF1 factor [Nothoprocta pentlandii]NWY04482.1 XAF1 factor [Nothoprocta ornata]
IHSISVLCSKRDVSAANFSLHEAHCLRFLTLCPECDEPIARKDTKDHQAEAHKQVRCNLCHHSMQQYQLEYHKTQECHERSMKCSICELEMPFNKLQEHLNSCASRTELCWECNKYVMYKDQNKHKDICLKSNLSNHKDVVALASQETSKPSTDPSQPSSSLSPSSNSENAMAWKDIRLKRKERDQPLTSNTLLKPPKKKKKVGFPSSTRSGLSTSPQALKDTLCYDMMVTCAHCNILLPLSTLQTHEV